MIGNVYTYVPSDIKLLVASHTVTGVEGISVVRTSKAFEIVKGIRGKNTRKRNTDSGAIITVQVMQTSSTNDVFSQIVSLDRLLGTGQLSVILTDGSGTTLIKSDNAFLEDYSEIQFGEEIQSRTWVINCLDTSAFVVGGNLQSGSIIDQLTQRISNLF